MLKSHEATEEWVDVIDEQNRVIGPVRRREAYAKALSHRIAHVMVVRGDEVLIARRSRSVSYMPGTYCTSAGGHVAAGEDVAMAAQREMREEIGLGGPVVLVGEFYFTHEFKVHVSVFVKIWNEDTDEVESSPREVMSTEFMRIDEVLALGSDESHPQLKPCLELLKLSWFGSTR